MTGIELLLREPAAQAIGWALLHFIWQGTLIGVLAAISLRLLRHSAADVRYVVSAIALSLLATMPLMTGIQTYKTMKSVGAVSGATVIRATGAPAQPRLDTTWTPSGAPSNAQVLSTPVSRPLRRSLDPAQVEPWLPMFVAVWLAGVAVLTIRLFGGWLWVQRMKSHGATAAGAELQSMATRLSKRLHLSRRVRLLQSAGVDVPTVIGWLKPVVLLPVTTLAGLSTTQVEAILAHELAHIRRHDYLVNLLQTFLETLLFYHPAVWWVSRRIRQERENCCDDLAVSLCGDPVAYARALADLEAHRGSAGSLVVAASGGALLQRVRRLLLGAPASHAGRGPVWLAAATALVLVAGIGATVVTTAPAGEPKVTLSLDAPRGAVQLPERPTSKSGQQSQAQTAPSAQSAPSAPSASPGPSAPSAQAGPSAPSAPSAPSSPSAPSAPSAPSGSGLFVSGQESRGSMSWSHNGEKLEVKYNGEFEFTDDDLDVKRMSPGANLKIGDGGWFKGRSVEFSADASGNITRRYWSGSSERPFEPEGRQWLAQSLPRFIRQTGIGAKARAGRIFKAQGAQGLLGEITKIEGSWAKKVYFTELLKMNVDANTVRQAFDQAGREISSDYELASLLIESGERLLTDDATRKAYFDASRSIQSDYEMRRVFSSGLKRGPLPTAILASMLEAGKNIESDYEQAELLVQVVKQQSIEPVSQPFFAALETLSSNYEHRRVLSALAARPDLGAETTAAMLKSAARMSSNYEAAEFLLQVSRNSIEGPQRGPFFAAVESIDSSYERGRVLQAILKRSDLSEETLLAALQAVSTMTSGYDASQVLQTAARNHTITGAARDAYIKTAQRLGDYDQSQVLAALVRNEKRR